MMINTTAFLLRISIVIGLYCCLLPSFGQEGSSQNSNKKTITRYFDEVINTQKLSRMGKFFSPKYVWHQMNGKDIRSSEDSSHISMLKFLFMAIPNIHYIIENMVAEGGLIAVNSTAVGTAKGDYFGYPGVQKNVHFKQMFFFRMVNNKIKEEWEVVDVDGLKEQLAKR